MAVRSSNRGRLSGRRRTPEKLEVTFDWINRHFFVVVGFFCYFGTSLSEIPPSLCVSRIAFPDLLLGILVASYLNRLQLEKKNNPSLL